MLAVVGFVVVRLISSVVGCSRTVAFGPIKDGTMDWFLELYYCFQTMTISTVKSDELQGDGIMGV